MATNQKVVGSDLFVVNRIETGVVKTYKTTANDIGVFLLEAPHPDGTNPDDKFVNDGCLNVYGNTPGVTQGYINLHSANEYCEGKLSFNEDFFVVTGSSLDVRVELNFHNLAGELACDGLDGSSNCLKLDMVWLAENIICDGKGLDNSCGNGIGIDLCDHSGLQFKANGCLQVNLCDKGIIHAPGDGCLEADLVYLTNNLSCNGLRPSDGDTTASCMEIDMVWLSNNIRCGDLHRPNNDNKDLESGLVDGDGCIRVDPCWVNDQLNTNNGNGQINVTDEMAKSIDTWECNLAVNEDWLLAWAQDNIHLISKKGGNDSSDCLQTSGNGNLFEEEFKIWIDKDCLKDTIDDRIEKLAVLSIEGDECIKVEPNNGKGPDIKLSLKDECKGSDAPEVNDGKITINQGGKFKGDFTVNQKNNTTINLDAGAGNPVTPNDGRLRILEGGGGIHISRKQNNTTVTSGHFTADTADNWDYEIEFQPAPDECTALGIITSTRVTNVTAGNPKIPGVTLGIQQQQFDSSGNPRPDFGNFIGLCGSASEKRIRLVGLEDWTGDACDPSIGKVSDDMTFFQREVKYKLDGSGNPIDDGSGWPIIESDKRNHKNATLGVELGTGHPVHHKRYQKNDVVQINRTVRHNPSSFIEGYTVDHTEGIESDQNFDIDAITDALAGVGTSNTVAEGLIKWEKVSDTFLDQFGGENAKNPQPFAPVLRADRLAQIHPALAEYDWSLDSYYKAPYEDDDPNDILTWGKLILKENESDRTRIPVKPNEHTLIVLLMVAIKRHKARIAELESNTTRTGMLNVLGIVEYNNETAAANSGLGQGEVYWDLELNRMRAVT